MWWVPGGHLLLGTSAVEMTLREGGSHPLHRFNSGEELITYVGEGIRNELLEH